MNDFGNKWILVGSLVVVFTITLIFSYGPGYGGGLYSFLSSNAGIYPEMSPSDIVTPMVTLKKVVTSRSVTNVTTVSPVVSSSIYSNYGASIYSSYSPSPITSLHPSVSPRISTMTPTPRVSPTVSPATPIPVVTPTPSPETLVETTSPTVIPEPETPTSTPTPTPVVISVGDIVINEIAWMGTGNTSKLSNDEWMELYNTTDQTIDLTGWTLNSLTGTSPDPQINLAHSIQPFGFYILERTDDNTIPGIIANQIYTGSLIDSGENLELKDSSGLLIDSVHSEGSWFGGDKASRSSMERIDPYKPGNDLTNWGTNNGINKNGLNAEGGLINGTPGQPNSIRVP